MIPLLLLANGLAENPEITYGTEDYEKFRRSLTYDQRISG